MLIFIFFLLFQFQALPNLLLVNIFIIFSRHPGPFNHHQPMHPNFQPRFQNNNNMHPPIFQGERFPNHHPHQQMPLPPPPQQQPQQPQIVQTLPPGAVVVNNPQNVCPLMAFFSVANFMLTSYN